MCVVYVCMCIRVMQFMGLVYGNVGTGSMKSKGQAGRLETPRQELPS